MFLMAHELATNTQSKSKYQEKPVLPDNPQERQKKLDQLDEDGYTKRRLYSMEELDKIEKLWNGIEDAEIKKGSTR